MMSSNADHLENGAPKPEHESELAPPATDPDPHSIAIGIQHPDIQSSDSKINNVVESELQSVHAEVSNSRSDEISIQPSVVTESEEKETNTNDVGSESKLEQEEGNRTFTMRELLNELKNGDTNEEVGIPRSQASTQQQNQNDAAMELIDNVTGVDEEGRSRQWILTFAARRYASAIERNPDHYDALYNWALVLQVYTSALKLVRSMLSDNLYSKSVDTTQTNKSAIKVGISDIVSVTACADLALPPGASLCIDTIQGPVFLIAESWESLDGWFDAIRLVYS